MLALFVCNVTAATVISSYGHLRSLLSALPICQRRGAALEHDPGDGAEQPQSKRRPEGIGAASRQQLGEYAIGAEIGGDAVEDGGVERRARPSAPVGLEADDLQHLVKVDRKSTRLNSSH